MNVPNTRIGKIARPVSYLAGRTAYVMTVPTRIVNHVSMVKVSSCMSDNYCIIGWPICPTCQQTLRLREMPGYHQTHWHCLICGDWETPDLISALVEEELWDYLGEA